MASLRGAIAFDAVSRRAFSPPGTAASDFRMPSPRGVRVSTTVPDVRVPSLRGVRASPVENISADQCTPLRLRKGPPADSVPRISLPPREPCVAMPAPGSADHAVGPPYRSSGAPPPRAGAFTGYSVRSSSRSTSSRAGSTPTSARDSPLNARGGHSVRLQGKSSAWQQPSAASSPPTSRPSSPRKPSPRSSPRSPVASSGLSFGGHGALWLRSAPASGDIAAREASPLRGGHPCHRRMSSPHRSASRSPSPSMRSAAGGSSSTSFGCGSALDSLLELRAEVQGLAASENVSSPSRWLPQRSTQAWHPTLAVPDSANGEDAANSELRLLLFKGDDVAQVMAAASPRRDSVENEAAASSAIDALPASTAAPASPRTKVGYGPYGRGGGGSRFLELGSESDAKSTTELLCEAAAAATAVLSRPRPKDNRALRSGEDKTLAASPSTASTALETATSASETDAALPGGDNAAERPLASCTAASGCHSSGDAAADETSCGARSRAGSRSSASACGSIGRRQSVKQPGSAPPPPTRKGRALPAYGLHQAHPRVGSPPPLTSSSSRQRTASSSRFDQPLRRLQRSCTSSTASIASPCDGMDVPVSEPAPSPCWSPTAGTGESDGARGGQQHENELFGSLSDKELREVADRALRGMVAPALQRRLGRRELLVLLSAQGVQDPANAPPLEQ
eukprot:gnl/TRDRNA2_/TRDRNA2_28883_c0_seq1.p1 gnl/TRDRNA2_/TRDRNA2_28883_c0~~gnl/TRDRNA2_/TRDRNA2_28883_c0_seq1.p1  ORF type:complete len:693 (+),score=74.48 gnl/TRDRNA2_/TRDRNA2_28883_c0_seq1:35-2080(+)